MLAFPQQVTQTMTFGENTHSCAHTEKPDPETDSPEPDRTEN